MKRIKVLSILRCLVQGLFFLLLPGLFTLVFGGIKTAYVAFIHGQANASIITALSPTLILVFLCLVFGRFFCGWICAFGTANDLLFSLARRIWKTRIRVAPGLDRLLKKVKYAVLLGIIALIWTTGADASQLNPWDVFAQISRFPQMQFEQPLAWILLGGIAVGATLIERFFCRYLCPLGAIQGLISELRLATIAKPTDQCGHCRACTAACPMGMELYRADDVPNNECISCLKCVSVCPKKNVKLGTERGLHPLLHATAALLAFTLLYSSTLLVQGMSLSGDRVTEQQIISDIITSQPATTTVKVYNDGVYTGTARGYRPNLTVSVTIKDDKITDIQITSHNESRGYFERASSIVPKAIIAAQSTSVDSVTGATRTSNGIKNAVSDALAKAKKQ